MDINEYKSKVIPKLRKRHIETSAEMINEAMQVYGFDIKPQSYFLNNSSDFIMTMRDILWNNFRNAEKKFNAAATTALFDNPQLMEQLNTLLYDVSLDDKQKLVNIVTGFSSNYEEHLFELNKSNTNSRRSRAGKEFEGLLKKILIKSNISFDDQGAVGTKKFSEGGLSKIVDYVVPGVLEYGIEKTHCALISMKTSLRERWQEVPEELSRTGAHFMYLFTLDRDISNEVITSLSEHKIYLVVLDVHKNDYYSSDNRIYGLSELLTELKRLTEYWQERTKQSVFTQSKSNYIQAKIDLFERRYKKTRLEYEKTFYQDRLDHFRNL
ncbi:type II restriction endonuclease [Paenibacillus sp. Soil787]|uniref:type II restriction endonuclease n=1 Tax=Paenibacillus sp. Soil787 TaxID=1736411 RepID=UPI0006FEB6C6|nr:type II restriction endonuclease [Paenibacillus sp. Soil787]KRF39831.1 hypothetical protein ASG93_22985 [Paenibacillus sp. Soil787]